MPEPHEAVFAVATIGFAARCLHVVSELGVADHIDDHPVPVVELAAACGAHPDALDRVLRLLAGHGIFDHRDGACGHTPPSRMLRSDHPMTMRPFARMMGLPFIWDSLAELEHAVRTGAPGSEILEPKGAWAYLRDRPEQAEVFDRAMTAKAGAEIAAVLATYDFGRFGTIADIGGGRGHLLHAVLEATPTAQGVLFDLPDVIRSVDLDHPRLAVQGGDFFADALPAADAYLLMEVLHDWPDDECVAILNAVRRAAPAGSTVLVLEGVLAEDHVDLHARTLDVVMLTVTGGRERTARELGVLFDRAGFRLGAVTDTPGPIRIVEAVPV